MTLRRPLRVVHRQVRSATGRVRSAVVTTREAILHSSAVVFLGFVGFVFAGALLLIGFGLHDLADLRDQRVETAANDIAASPIAYGARIAFQSEVSGGYGARGEPGLTALLRIDSLPEGKDAAEACRSAVRIERSLALRTDVSLQYVAQNEPAASCVHWLAVDAAAQVRDPTDSSASSTLPWNSMRWAIVDAEGRSLYSHRDWPTLEEIVGVLDALRGRPYNVGTVAASP